MACAGPGDPAPHQPARRRGPTGEPSEFAVALRSAIAERGLSLERLRYHLARHGHELSIAALSYWQSGRSRPERPSSLAALASLEDILRVEPGALSCLLPNAAVVVTSRDEVDVAALAVMAGLGTPRDEGYSWLSVYERLELDQQGVLRRRSLRGVLRATRTEVVGFPVVWRDAAAGDDVRIEPRAHCRVGHAIDLPDGIAAQVLFDRPLHARETTVIDLDFICAGPAPPLTRWDVTCRARRRESYVEVAFAEPRLPLVAQRVVEVGGRESAEFVPVSGARLTSLVQDFGPGVVGLRWKW